MEKRPTPVRNMGIEQPPPNAPLKPGTDIPVFGGSLFFNQCTGLAGCEKCGWSGVPVFRDGVASTRCPSCDAAQYSQRSHHTRGIARNKSKRKAAKKSRKGNRKR